MSKKRKYAEEYLQYGFVESTVNGEVVPTCVICFENLSNDAFRPSRLQRHFFKHPGMQSKPLAYFESKKASFMKLQVAAKKNFCESLSGTLEASFEISFMIARAKKPHDICENLVKPCLLKAGGLVLVETSAKKLAKISLSDSTVNRRIDEVAADIEIQLLEKVHASPLFAIQCDETTDVTQLSQLLVYVRYVGSTTIEEDLLFCKSLETTTKAEDVFDAIASYFENNYVKWENLVGICTDRAPTMLGSRSVFVTRMKHKNPNAVGTHCVIHREALASKTLPATMNETLTTAVRIVNFVKTSALNSRLFTKLCNDMDSNHYTLLFHTSVRWLSRGNTLARIYELRDELKLFFEDRGRQDLLLTFTSDKFQRNLAYLVDIFEALNSLNRRLQGKDTHRIDHYDEIRVFIAKLRLWLRRAAKGNAASFPNLDDVLENDKDDLHGEPKSEVEAHLQHLIDEFERYFPDINNVELPEWKMTRDLFRVNEDVLSDDLQEEFLELKFNSSAKEDFEAMPLGDFWGKYARVYQKIVSSALRILLPFSSTYLCESAFSALVNIKTKARNRLDCHADLQCALSSSTKPRFKLLASRKQLHVSH